MIQIQKNEGPIGHAIENGMEIESLTEYCTITEIELEEAILCMAGRLASVKMKRRMNALAETGSVSETRIAP